MKVHAVLASSLNGDKWSASLSGLFNLWGRIFDWTPGSLSPTAGIDKLAKEKSPSLMGIDLQTSSLAPFTPLSHTCHRDAIRKCV